MINCPFSNKSKICQDLRRAAFLLLLKIPQPPPNLLAAEVPAGGQQWQKKKHELSLLWHCEGKEEMAALPLLPLPQKCSYALGKTGLSARSYFSGPTTIGCLIILQSKLEHD